MFEEFIALHNGADSARRRIEESLHRRRVGPYKSYGEFWADLQSRSREYACRVWAGVVICSRMRASARRTSDPIASGSPENLNRGT
jgi:hypothetical protein